MKKILTATALALTPGLSAGPATAADAAACQASWTKMDAKKAGFVMGVDAKTEGAAMTKADKKMAAADRITDKEYMESCLADVFKPSM